MKIVISGTTGIGKSTTVNFIKKYYQQKGKKVCVIGELVVDNPYFDLYFDDLQN
jgi:deoxyadenosine/deoxycytidine kinase